MRFSMEFPCRLRNRPDSPCVRRDVVSARFKGNIRTGSLGSTPHVEVGGFPVSGQPTRGGATMKMRIWVFLAASLWILPIGVLLRAATPSSGTLTDTSGPVNYTSGPFTGANPTPIPEVDSGPECLNPVQPCDDFALTVTLPSGYAAAHPNAALKITAGWTDTGSGKSDYDLYVYRGVVINTDGSQTADYQSASSSNPEVATIAPVADGTSRFTVKVVPYTPTGESVNVKIELLRSEERRVGK